MGHKGGTFSGVCSCRAWSRVLYIACLLIAATGSCDAGGLSDGHVRSGAADVPVDAAVGFGLTLYPVRRFRLAVEFDAVATFCNGGYRTADSSFVSARVRGRVAMKLDITKNLLGLRLERCSERHAKTCQAGTTDPAHCSRDRGLTHRGYRVL